MYKCTRNLFARGAGMMVKSFSKDKKYEDQGPAQSGNGLVFINDYGQAHEVTDDESRGGWLKYFVLPEEDDADISELKDIIKTGFVPGEPIHV